MTSVGLDDRFEPNKQRTKNWFLMLQIQTTEN